MQLSYQTQRLLLRVLQPNKAASVLNFYQRNQTFLEPFEPKRQPDFFTYDFQYANLSGEYSAFFRMNYLRLWLSLPQLPDYLIGSICFSNFLRGSFCNCMLGYKMDQNCCHQGYMKEALSFLLPLVCKEYELHRIEAMVMPSNEASIRLLQSLHFQEEGYLHEYAQINGKWQDHLIYSYLHSSGDGSRSIQ